MPAFNPVSWELATIAESNTNTAITTFTASITSNGEGGRSISTASARSTASIIVNVICVSTAGALQVCGVNIEYI